jgi:hypothetical protein
MGNNADLIKTALLAHSKIFSVQKLGLFSKTVCKFRSKQNIFGQKPTKNNM